MSKPSNRAKASRVTTRSTNSPTEKRIVDEAVIILAKEGYEHFTLRAIAQRVGIRLNAVQHYFPTKPLILRAAIEQAIGTYDERMDLLASQSAIDPESRFLAVAELHLASCVDELTGGFFIAFWGLTTHDSDALQLLNDTYRNACERFARLIRDLDPAVALEESRLRAVQILALLEGTTVTAGPRMLYAAKLKQLRPKLVQTALRIARPHESALR
jgi:AcrR family transcriptional regulator